MLATTSTRPCSAATCSGACTFQGGGSAEGPAEDGAPSCAVRSEFVQHPHTMAAAAQARRRRIDPGNMGRPRSVHASSFCPKPSVAPSAPTWPLLLPMRLSAPAAMSAAATSDLPRMQAM